MPRAEQACHIGPIEGLPPKKALCGSQDAQTRWQPLVAPGKSAKRCPCVREAELGSSGS